MCDEKLHKAINEFIQQRIIDCGIRTNTNLQEAYNQFGDCFEQMKNSLIKEQISVFIDFENAYSLVNGESMNFYYRAGFSDAVLFLQGWRDGEWN